MSMSLRKLEAQGAKRGGVRHSIYGFLASGKLPSGRAWKRAQQEISRLREALIAQYGGDKIQPAVLALLESAIEGLTIQRLSGLYVKKAGILRRDSLKRGDLALHSILSGQFISYANLVRLNLESAARLAAQKPLEDPAATVAELIAEVDAEAELEAQAAKAREASAGGPGVAQGERAAAGQDDGKGQEGADPGGNGHGAGKRGPGIAPETRSPDGAGRDVDEDQGE